MEPVQIDLAAAAAADDEEYEGYEDEEGGFGDATGETCPTSADMSDDDDGEETDENCSEAETWEVRRKLAKRVKGVIDRAKTRGLGPNALMEPMAAFVFGAYTETLHGSVHDAGGGAGVEAGACSQAAASYISSLHVPTNTSHRPTVHPP